MRSLLVLCCALVTVFGRPQEFVSEDEVELVPAVNTNQGPELDGDRDPVVVVVRIPGLGSGSDDESSFPGLGSFPGFSNNPFAGFGGIFGNNRPRLPELPKIPQVHGDPFDVFDDIFSGVANLPRDDSAVEDGEVELIEPVDTNPGVRPGCGLLCTMFGIFHGLQEEIDVINKEIHPQDSGVASPLPAAPDVNNTSYEEKVLDDGTKVGINKSVFSNTDENGNSFFIQTTFTQHLPALPPVDDDSVEYEADLPEDEEVEETDDYPASDEFPIKDVKPVETPEEETTDAAVIPDEDPSLNEIDGVDEGLKE